MSLSFSNFGAVQPAVKPVSAVKPAVQPAVKPQPAVQPAVKPAVKPPVKPQPAVQPAVKPPVKPQPAVQPAVKPQPALIDIKKQETLAKQNADNTYSLVQKLYNVPFNYQQMNTVQLDAALKIMEPLLLQAKSAMNNAIAADKLANTVQSRKSVSDAKSYIATADIFIKEKRIRVDLSRKYDIAVAEATARANYIYGLTQEQKSILALMKKQHGEVLRLSDIVQFAPSNTQAYNSMNQAFQSLNTYYNQLNQQYTKNNSIEQLFPNLEQGQIYLNDATSYIRFANDAINNYNITEGAKKELEKSKIEKQNVIDKYVLISNNLLKYDLNNSESINSLNNSIEKIKSSLASVSKIQNQWLVRKEYKAINDLLIEVNGILQEINELIEEINNSPQLIQVKVEKGSTESEEESEEGSLGLNTTSMERFGQNVSNNNKILIGVVILIIGYLIYKNRKNKSNSFFGKKFKF